MFVLHVNTLISSNARSYTQMSLPVFWRNVVLHLNDKLFDAPINWFCRVPIQHIYMQFTWLELLRKDITNTSSYLTSAAAERS